MPECRGCGEDYDKDMLEHGMCHSCIMDYLDRQERGDDDDDDD